jgi:RimJ/RimL family protein N-acetyltransferase
MSPAEANPNPVEVWPLFGLRIKTPALELRLPTDVDLVGLAHLAARGIHDDDFMPFAFPWTRRPSPDLERGVLQHHWALRAQWSPGNWHLGLVVLRDGIIVGNQGIGASDFAIRRVVATGSWVGREFQGQGIGKEMRAAVLHLAFEGLGAVRAFSSAREDNIGSLGVSRSLGYQQDGDDIRNVEGTAVREIRMILSRQRWEAHRRADISISGLEGSLALFGAA